MSQQPLNLDAIEEQLARTLGLIETGNQSQLDQIDKLATAQSGKINGKLLTKSGQGSTWGGFFKNPTDNQREGFLNAGLALLGSSNNENLSQRIGQAIGAGVGAIREGREFDREQKIAKQSLELKKLGIKQAGLKDRFGMQLQGANFGLAEMRERNAQARHKETEDAKNRRAEEARNNISGVGNFQFTDKGVTKSMPVVRTSNGIFLPDANKTPLGNALTPEQIASGTMNPSNAAPPELLKLHEALDRETDPVKKQNIQNRIAKLNAQSGGISVTTDKHGNTTTQIGGSQTKPSKIVTDSMVMADLAQGGIFRNMDVMFDPAFDASTGRLGGRLTRMTSFFQPEEVRSIIDRTKKAGNMAALSKAPLVKPLSDDERVFLIETMGFNPFLTADSNVKQKMRLDIPESLSVIETAHNAIQNSGSFFRSRMGEDFFMESYEGAMQNGSVGNLLAQGYGDVFIDKWAPRVSPQFSGKGYYEVRGKAISGDMVTFLAREYGRTVDQMINILEAEIIE